MNHYISGQEKGQLENEDKRERFWTQGSLHNAANEILIGLAPFALEEALSVIDLARARLSIQKAINVRIAQECREENGKQGLPADSFDQLGLIKQI